MSRFLALLLFAPALIAASWTSGGPYGGAIQALASSSSNPRVVYAAGYRGVFRSDDNGDTWRSVNNGIAGWIARLTVDPHDPNVVYGIAGGGFGPVYRTTNGGATWSTVDVSLYRPNTILIDPSNSNIVYAAGDCGYAAKLTTRATGVKKSTDGGKTWSDATGFNQVYAECVTSMSLDPANPSHLFVFSVEDAESGYWQSFDGAATWTLSAGPLPSREVIADPRPAVANQRYGTDGTRWLISTDGGVHWSEQTAAGLPARITAFSADLAVDPSVPRLFRTTQAGLYRSGDGGASWVPAGDAPRIEVNAVLFNPADSTVMIGTSQGVYRAPSPKFTPWTQLAVPESGITSITEIAPDLRRPSIVYASTQDGTIPGGRIFRSRNSGASWELLDASTPRARMAVTGSGDLFFAADFSATLYRIRDGASDIELVRDFSNIRRVVAPPDALGRVYIDDAAKLWRTDDSGQTWQRCGGGETLLASVQADIVYAITNGALMKSTDGCNSFHALPGEVGTTWSVAPAPSDASIVYANRGLQPALWRSDDGGETWTPTAAPIDGSSAKVAVDPRDARSVWVWSASYGMRHSSDAGATWSDVTDGLPSSGVTALAADGAGTLHAGLLGAGVWELGAVRPRVRSVRPR